MTFCHCSCYVRWDLQRARTLIQHQYLLDRYKRIHEKTLKPTNQKPSKPNIDTFLPKPQESNEVILKTNAVFMMVFLVKEVEISDTLPLMAFGCSIPYVEPRYDVEVTRFVSLLHKWGIVVNLNFRGLILMKEMPRKQFGQHVAEQGPVKLAPSQVLQAQTQPQQHNSHTHIHNHIQHVLFSFCMYILAIVLTDLISIQRNF